MESRIIMEQMSLTKQEAERISCMVTCCTKRILWAKCSKGKTAFPHKFLQRPCQDSMNIPSMQIINQIPSRILNAQGLNMQTSILLPLHANHSTPHYLENSVSYAILKRAVPIAWRVTSKLCKSNSRFIKIDFLPHQAGEMHHPLHPRVWKKQHTISEYP
jgi:hypothetical protein